DDLGLIVYQAQCTNDLVDCACASDTGFPGNPNPNGNTEGVVLNAIAGTDYFIVVDGYSATGAPPGDAGPFTLSIAGSGWSLVGGVPEADLKITKTDGQASYAPGGVLTYTITVTNQGPNSVTGETVTDSFPADLGSISWTCTASLGSACGSTSGNGNISATVDLLSTGTATFTVTATASLTATGSISNTASVAPPGGTTEPD